MGLIAKVLSFVTRDVKVDRGGGDNITAQHFSDPGDDSQPLPGDYVTVSDSNGTGRQTASGYIDAKNAPQAGPGEKRIYSRDASGAVAVELWLKSDKSAVLTNGVGTLTMLSDGSFNINGFTISPTGGATSANGVTLDEHKHTQPADSAGNTQASTNAPTVGT